MPLHRETCLELRHRAEQARVEANRLGNIKARERALKKAEQLEEQAENREGCL